MSTRNIQRRRSANAIKSAGLPVVVERLESRKLLSVIPVDPEFPVNLEDGERCDPSIAVDADGDFVIAWTGYGQSSEYGEIYAQRYNVAGIPQGTELLVNTTTADVQYEPSVAVDADGDFVIAWTGYKNGSSYNIYAQRFNAAGVKQGAEFRVNTYTIDWQYEPSVAMDAGGDFVIAWTSYYQDGDYGGVYAQRYNAAGTKQGNESRVSTYTIDHQGDPSVAMDSDGDFVIAWTSYYQDSDYSGVYAQRYNAAGAKQGDEFRVSTPLDWDHFEPSAGMDADGDFVIAFATYYQDDEDLGIYAQRYNAAGDTQGGLFLVNSEIFGDQSAPAVAMAADGDFLIAWESSYQDGNGSGIYAQRYNADGVAQEPEFIVNSFTEDDQVGACVAMDADGDFVIAWHSYYQNNSGGCGVYAQRYAVVPEVTASSFVFESAPQRLRFSFDRDVSSSLGSDDLLVQNLTTGQTISSTLFTVSYDLSIDVADFSYSGGILPDGNYQVTLLTAEIATPAGAPLKTDHVFGFFVLAGDANRDRKVDGGDLDIVVANWQQSSRTFSLGDFDLNGVVDVADLGILASNWQEGVASFFGRAANPPIALVVLASCRKILQTQMVLHLTLCHPQVATGVNGLTRLAATQGRWR